MPELPEVETVRRILLPIVTNETITAIDVLKARIIQGDVTSFVDGIEKETFKDISRIGKYLIFHLTNHKVLVSHLRMEGKYIELLPEQPLSRFARIVFHFASGKRLVYDDSRQFGTMRLTTEKDYRLLPELAKLGAEPFDANTNEIYRKVVRSNRAIKEILLDQTVLTGLGNIYVDEVLFECQIHPLTPGKLLTENDIKRIISSSIIILNRAIESGGSTIRSYHPGNGISGDFQLSIVAYNQGGKPCVRCGHQMKKIRVGGRGTTYCPYCQTQPNVAKTIAITGPIASGKSSLSKIYAEMGYPVLSSDAVVHELYQDKDIVFQLEKKLEHKITKYKKLDRDKLRHLVFNDKQAKKAVESFIHPLVGKRIQSFMAQTKSDFVFVEVPLLYQARMETMFDYVIGIITSPERQRDFLAGRGSNPNDAAMLNSCEHFKKYENKLDYLIRNVGDYESLKEQALGVLNHIKK